MVCSGAEAEGVDGFINPIIFFAFYSWLILIPLPVCRIKAPEDDGRPPHRQSLRRERSFPMEGINGISAFFLTSLMAHRAGACIYQINESAKNAPEEKPDAYMPLVASKRSPPNVVHSASVSSKT
jgi:hypothetical protein